MSSRSLHASISLMDSPQDLRLSDSPQRTPQISQHFTSPPRSVRPELFLESIDSQADMMPKGLDYFDDVSSDGIETIDANRASTDIATFLRCHDLEGKQETSKPLEEANRHKYDQSCDDQLAGSYARLSAPFQEPLCSSRTSLCGSAHEPIAKDVPQPSFDTSRKSQPEIARVPHRSADVANLRERSQSEAAQLKTDRILSAHAIAHRITLQALMHEGDELSNTWPGADRSSTLRPGSHFSDVQSHFDQFASPVPQRLRKAEQSPFHISERGVTFPPASYKSPLVYEEEKNRHESQKSAPASVAAYESALRISVKRQHRHSRQRVAFIKIPASKDFTAVKDSPYKTKQLHFRALEFDDATFFRELRRTYKHLVGPWRVFGARSLARVMPTSSVPSTTFAIDGLQKPQSVTAHHRTEIISEEHFRRHFCRPDLGKSRWDFVDWAQRVAAEPTSPNICETRRSQSVSQHRHEMALCEGCAPGCEGVEFVLSWSKWRILLFSGTVMLASMAATLCWVFLGKSTAMVEGDGGFQDAGDRVAAGVLMGIGVMLIGLCTMAGWLGASWLAV
ncbi:hypothetical protein K431DRAFT_97922 [Polychaeton citri CBS 116435]|uniref:Uncharacterized protein n=1 Tax=Polychaeton citri CBS 116435 TaxID=1314669 RepID=A0A9P4UP62_9PEZI|nr:hypothetical protein K431DRAFT_97922 [Polychaeton citri CBS 116435]